MKRSTPSFPFSTIPTRASWTQAFSRVITSLILGVAMSAVAYAQQGVSLYTYAASSGTYTALSGGTTWQSGTALNTDAITAVSLPWSFTYNA
ncbi:MAG: hypothetical protein JST83_06055, partial [Bacteroidetes bacterium]|nr:hypothetical protein [Bacteroidota bacterium]